MTDGQTFRWADRQVAVTGGASFIGSHLVDALIARGARVRAVDDLSSGRLSNIAGHLEAGRLDFARADLRDPAEAARAVAGAATVFHLAADHGGRGYVDTHQAACAGNLLLDAQVFRACVDAHVEKVVYASSGCVYPNFLQADPNAECYLDEAMVGPPYDADNMYGWAKLMGELTLRAFRREHGLGAASCRYFTVYGPRGVENHALMAMIARAHLRQDPFEVWGTGDQVRNWTYISDIVEGTMLAAERLDDAEAVNLGTSERIRVADAARAIAAHMGHHPQFLFRPDMPTGPYNRVADHAFARERLGWQPRVPFAEGIRRTIAWYQAGHTGPASVDALEQRLLER